MTVTLGILALREAKAGKGEQLAAFLKAGQELAVAEQGTVTCILGQVRPDQHGQQADQAPEQAVGERQQHPAMVPATPLIPQ
jgi:hypothetical protein